MDRIHTAQEGGPVAALHENGNEFSVFINYKGFLKIICATVGFSRRTTMC